MGKRSRERREQRAQHESTARQSFEVEALRRARAFHSQGQLAAAEAVYRELLQRNPNHSEALHLLGVSALQVDRAEDAVKLISHALRLDPRNARAHANLGSALLRLKRWEEALAGYDRALQLDPLFTAVHHNRGNTLQMLARHEEAAQSFERLFESTPNADFSLGNLLHSRGIGCDWTHFGEHVQRLLPAVRAGRRAARPFPFLALSSSAADQLQCARTYVGYVSPASPTPLWRGERYGHDRIRIAYVSADFRDHIVTRLMTPVYERHDTQEFLVVGVALAGSDDSAVTSRAKHALGDFIDVTEMSDADAARRLRELEIDIAVDLTGHTLGGRPGIFAHRPAPVQVNYLGFPGTMGAPWMDYILADEFVIPPASQAHYLEKVVYLPETFQANDERRAAAAVAPPVTRDAVGLPEGALVYCCFNSNYKIGPHMFDIWARLLRSEPRGVLWLLGDRPTVQTRLRDEATRRGVDAERIIFAPRVSYEQHLARLALADLFLDTVPFNAGATASDVLWAGVPILTCSGEALAARMAGSLLRALGVPELVTSSLEEYERIALTLAADPTRLADYKARLTARRPTATVFDSERFCRHLESAYHHMWERSRRGDSPVSFSVGPLLPGA